MRKQQIREVLGKGRKGTHPFHFKVRDGTEGFERTVHILAAGSGFDGFLHTLEEIVECYGWDAIAHHNHSGAFAAYARHLGFELRGGREGLAEIRKLGLQLRNEIASPSDWAREARIYQIFPRAFGLAGWRALHGQEAGNGQPFFAEWTEGDFGTLKELGFDCVWLMGINPISKRGARGGVGSPYAIDNHRKVDPSLGTESDFQKFVNMAHKAGIRILLDIVPNHRGMDSHLLDEHPEWFLHLQPTHGKEHNPPHGYFLHVTSNGGAWWIRHAGCEYHGKLAYWWDVAQLNLAHPDVRQNSIDTAVYWVRQFGVDGYRIDMAYQLLKHYYFRNWQIQIEGRELLEEIIQAVREIRPDAGFIAEAYGCDEQLTAVGADAILQKTTWWDAQRWDRGREGVDSVRIQSEIERAAWLHYQRSHAAGYYFVSNHDEAPPWHAFGPWEKGAAVLTLCLPGSLLWWGSNEVGFDGYSQDDHPKSIPFTRNIVVQWEATARWAFYRWLFRESARLRKELGKTRMKPLEPNRRKGWVGYLLKSEENDCSYAVVANPTNNPTEGNLATPRDGMRKFVLAPWGYGIIKVS